MSSTISKKSRPMKINLIQSIIAVALGALIAYGLFSFHKGENKQLLAIGSFIFLAITLLFATGAQFESARTTTNIRALSGLFFTIALISNSIFTFIDFIVPLYVVINGLLLLVFISILYAINSAKQ
jgi:uncharacterized membrane protein YgaE (UPF0421/DUF939 family)